MANPLPYDPSDSSSIEDYAKRLLNRSLRDVIDVSDLKKYGGRGSFGQLVEHAYFQYAPNSNSEPDFKEAGVELKTNPIKRTKKGYSSKERLVFNIIDYEKEHSRAFTESSFWHKNKLILLMMYLHEKGQADLDYVFKFIQLWPFPEEDLIIIRQDWQKIIDKIKAGKAHELSEGDTLYLGACTKGANKESLRKQPFSDIMAMQRAYSLKSKYLNAIIQGGAFKSDFKPIIKDPAILKKETFEQYVIRQFIAQYGKSVSELTSDHELKATKAKHKLYLLAMAILGVKDAKAAEFEKADIVIKTIKLEESGSLKESMSFEQIKFQEIVDEEWEDSYWHHTVHKRFLFIVFQWQGEELVLKKALFWNMPHQDIIAAEEYWKHTKAKIQSNDYSNFYKMADDKLFHVRPKARDSRDLMPTPAGGMEKKKAYWINASYIKRIIS